MKNPKVTHALVMLSNYLVNRRVGQTQVPVDETSSNPDLFLGRRLLECLWIEDSLD
jgi:hypothetical protein